jgi:Tfp pilus assembly protein PilX
MQQMNSLEKRSSPTRRHERGAALLISVLMLLLMGMLGMSSLDTVMRDRQIAGFTSRARSALYAADAGVAAALDLVRTSDLPTALAPGDCLGANIATTSLPNGASFAPDSTAPASLCMISSAEPCSELDASIEVGSGSVYLYTLWDMRIQGQTPDGAVARVQATAQRCHAFN